MSVTPGAGEVITSAANPLIKRIRRLATDRRFRAREGVFVVEGGQPVWRAVSSGRRIERLVVCWDLVHLDAARAMVQQFADDGGSVTQVSTDVFAKLSERDGPSGVLALVDADLATLSGLVAGSNDTFVALEHVGNPGNLGTIIRTADAAGAAGVVLIGHSADPFDPSAVKASMGSVFAVPVARVGTIADFAAWAGAQNVRVVATSGAASETHWSLPRRTPTALLFGAEGPGLTPEALDIADATVRIPMVGTAESLNLSIAVAVALYEVQRDALSHGALD